MTISSVNDECNNRKQGKYNDTSIISSSVNDRCNNTGRKKKYTSFYFKLDQTTIFETKWSNFLIEIQKYQGNRYKWVFIQRP